MNYKVNLNTDYENYIYISNYNDLANLLGRNGFSVPKNEEDFTAEMRAFILRKKISVEIVDTIPVTVQQAKEDKIADFKARRDYEEVQALSYNGNLFDVDKEFSLPRIQVAMVALAAQGQNNPSIAWTTYDGNTVNMHYADFVSLLAGMAVRSDTLHVKYRELKEAVEECATVEEVEAIAWGE